MSRFDEIDFSTVISNLYDDIYVKLDDIKRSLANEEGPVPFDGELFWGGVYSSFLQMEELVTYLNADVELENDDHDSASLDLEKDGIDSFHQRVDIIVEKVEELVERLQSDTKHMTGLRLGLILFHQKLEDLRNALKKDDFEEFHVHLKQLIPDIEEYILNKDDWQNTYFELVEGTEFTP